MKITRHNLISFGKKIILRNPIRTSRIRRTQAERLQRDYPVTTDGLVVLLTPGEDVIYGGTLSIASIYRETRGFSETLCSNVIVCTMPGDPLLLRYTTFEDAPDMFELSKVLEYFTRVTRILIHVPEYGIGQFLRHLSMSDRERLEHIQDRHFNILLQNPKLLSSQKDISALSGLGRVTATTAHAKYSTVEMRSRVGVPLHRLSVFNSPEQYERRAYPYKENLMIVSPDKHPTKRAVLNQLQAAFPRLEIQVVKKLTYQDYKRLVARAKWAITFGEGLDGYFLETVLSGGISFATFNPMYFTDDFRKLQTVYESVDVLASRIVRDIAALDNENAYTVYQQAQYALCAQYYKHEDYVDNLRLFYEGKYTFP